MQINLRPWQQEDIIQLTALANNKNIAKYMADVFPHPYITQNATAFIEMVNSKNPVSVFAITLNGQPVGSIGLHAQADILRKNYELGYWLAEEYWGKGIITEAIHKMVDYGFKNLDTVRIFARIFGNNQASQKAIIKAGFKLEGKFEKTIFKNGEFLDELIYAIRKSS